MSDKNAENAQTDDVQSEDTKTPIEGTEKPQEGTDAPDRVPVRELQKERRERKKLEQQLEQLQAAQEEKRKAELSEVEALKEELEKTKQEAKAAENARVLSEQQSLVRTAAAQKGFADAADAITFVNFESLQGLSGQELTQAVADEITRISEEKPYLLQKDEHKRSVGKAADREGADQPVPTGDDALGGFVQSLLFGKK